MLKYFVKAKISLLYNNQLFMRTNSSSTYLTICLLIVFMVMQMDGQVCGPNCNSCTSLTQCTNCQSGFFCCDPYCAKCGVGSGDDIGNVGCTQCQSGFVLNQTTNQCQISTCVTSSNTCLTCSGNTCVGCITGEYVNGGANVCYSCGVSYCATCSAYGNCTTCMQGFYVKSAKTTTSPNSCSSCSDNSFMCTACSAANTCTACEEGYFLNSTSNQCFTCAYPCTGCVQSGCTNCPDGYFIANTTCALCNYPCATCGGTADSCSSCQNGLILNIDVCQNCSSFLPQCLVCNQTTTPPTCQTCQTGFYPNPSSNGECAACDIKCQACSNATTCTQCFSAYALNSNGSCISCSDNCASCRLVANNPSFNSTCISCQSGAILLSSPSNSSVLVCQLCTYYATPNCAICTSDKTCTQCYQSYNLIGQQCISVFDSGTPWWAVFIIVIGLLLMAMLIGGFVYYIFFMKKPYPQSLLSSTERIAAE